MRIDDLGMGLAVLTGAPALALNTNFRPHFYPIRGISMASRIFWQFEGPKVKGSSLMKGHEGMQEMTSYSHSWEQPADPVSGSQAAPPPHHGTFNMTMELDESLIAMLGLLWSGKHIEKGTLTCYRVAGEDPNKLETLPYLKVELEAIVITHLDIAGGPGEAQPVTISLKYAKVTYTYQVSDQSKGTPGAAIPKSHDLRTNVVA